MNLIIKHMFTQHSRDLILIFSNCVYLKTRLRIKCLQVYIININLGLVCVTLLITYI